ncbi:MAG: MFS transporter, partial [Microbacteriaceae bacterium]
MSSPHPDRPPQAVFTPTGTVPAATDRRRVILATVIGTTVEWYDFFIYAFAAGVVFANLFFEPMGADFA